MIYLERTDLKGMLVTRTGGKAKLVTQKKLLVFKAVREPNLDLFFNLVTLFFRPSITTLLFCDSVSLSTFQEKYF